MSLKTKKGLNIKGKSQHTLERRYYQKSKIKTRQTIHDNYEYIWDSTHDESLH